jgi:multisite-specific tRNA:(cytosine-C5)-methyltransferase
VENRHALAVQQRLKEFYIPKITSITYEGEYVEAPQPVPWYPDQLAWFMTTPKNVIRRFPPFASFQKFLVNESDVGNISRQEVVSMIPPLLMDLKPGMTVLDLCAAPGSKSAQLIEMVHAGEEERTREVAQHLANGLERPAGDEYADDGRSTGLLIANDVDYKRAHMLVHQMKRLSSPNIIVTNHDATIFPSIKLPSESSGEGKPVPNRYLKFDRILADVPCSGDGTARKNLDIWRNWTPSNGLGLHMTQVRILMRAVQMLKPGGRVVYSTCSMNPVENEAVLAHAIELCGGPEMLYLIDTSGFLPNLKRYPGLKTWKVMDKTGRIWSSFEEVKAQRTKYGDDGLGRLQKEMFSPVRDLSLDRCMRIYPCQQDTGAFFIAILERKGQEVSKAKTVPAEALPENAHVIDELVQRSLIAHTRAPGASEVQDTELDQAETAFPPSSKRKIDDEDEEATSSKRLRIEESVQLDQQYTEITNGLATADVDSYNDPIEPIDGHDPVDARPNGTIHDDPEQTISQSAETPVENPTIPQPKSQDQPYKTKKRGQPFEEPFKYLSPTSPELTQVYAFYTISPRFPRDRFMVRNAAGTPSKNVYYTTSLAKAILQENEGKGMKFVHAGVKMFVKQDVPNPEICPWRIQTDGMAILEAWVGLERVVKLKKKETFRKLLEEMFPRFHGDEWVNLAEIGEQVLKVGMGCCVLRIEPSEDEDGLR